MSFSDYDTWKLSYPPHWDDPEPEDEDMILGDLCHAERDADPDDDLPETEPDSAPWWVWESVMTGCYTFRFALMFWWRWLRSTPVTGSMHECNRRIFWKRLQPYYQHVNASSAPWVEEMPF